MSAIGAKQPDLAFVPQGHFKSAQTARNTGRISGLFHCDGGTPLFGAERPQYAMFTSGGSVTSLNALTEPVASRCNVEALDGPRLTWRECAGLQTTAGGCCWGVVTGPAITIRADGNYFLGSA